MKTMAENYGAYEMLDRVMTLDLSMRGTINKLYDAARELTGELPLTYAAAKKLADETKPSSLRSLAEVTSKDIFDSAKTGDAMALKLVDTLGEMLGSALAHITAVVDPDVIVIGGGVSKAGQILLDAIVKHYHPAAFHACRDTEFKLAVLGNDAGMYGAVRMVLNS